MTGRDNITSLDTFEMEFFLKKNGDYLSFPQNSQNKRCWVPTFCAKNSEKKE